MYQASKSSGGGSASTSSVSSSVGGGRSGNAWNDFQNANAGQGYSRAKMSSMYQDSKQSSASSQQKHETTGRATNSWNGFQKETAGQGLTKQEQSAMYRERKEETARNSPKTSPAISPPSEQEKKQGTRTNSWNTFQASIGKMGYSKQEMKEMYHESKQAALSAVKTNLAGRFDDAQIELQRASGAATSHFDTFVSLNMHRPAVHTIPHKALVQMKAITTEAAPQTTEVSLPLQNRTDR
jgi:hypothetical protein